MVRMYTAAELGREAIAPSGAEHTGETVILTGADLRRWRAVPRVCDLLNDMAALAKRGQEPGRNQGAYLDRLETLLLVLSVNLR